MQSWYIPNKEEEEVLSFSMNKIVVDLRQMKMEGKAKKARREWEEKEAEKKAKLKNKTKK